MPRAWTCGASFVSFSVPSMAHMDSPLHFPVKTERCLRALGAGLCNDKANRPRPTAPCGYCLTHRGGNMTTLSAEFSNRLGRLRRVPDMADD
ncbi:hypothetical protein K491DRAFT_90249 [Lophiostoma macrostomum CBS 122681]|uniref:Uncharacterized protein n=1 Tax=Lophiostoma macrostomum CBS 122681 TaxID=1314788 RepID=A0A6A6SY27_9PLEO|nr:hypothetical protein K491DRAFT_90249 [Lophiostoma macrostomum CBS 122681]